MKVEFCPIKILIYNFLKQSNACQISLRHIFEADILWLFGKKTWRMLAAEWWCDHKPLIPVQNASSSSTLWILALLIIQMMFWAVKLILGRMPCYVIHIATHMDRDVPLYQSFSFLNIVQKQIADFGKAFW